MQARLRIASERDFLTRLIARCAVTCNTEGLRLTLDLDLDRVAPEEAFAILGNETRLDIIQALWEADALHDYDDLDDSASTISFSELRRRVEIEDNGKFNYHLSKLTPHFVRRTDGGYRLSGAGKRIARTVIAISGERNPGISEEVATECPLCGAPVRASYEDQWLRFACTECDGMFGDVAPEGTILNSPFPRAGLDDRTPDETMEVELYRCMLDLSYMMQGVCRECAGPVTGSVSVCDHHGTGAGEPCETCGTPFVAWGELRCGTCRFAKRLPIGLCSMGLSPVIGFLYSHGVDVLTPSLDEIVEVLDTRVSTVVTEDPFRATTTIETGHDALTLTLDEEMTLIDVSH